MQADLAVVGTEVERGAPAAVPAGYAFILRGRFVELKAAQFDRAGNGSSYKCEGAACWKGDIDRVLDGMKIVDAFWIEHAAIDNRPADALGRNVRASQFA